MCIIIINIVSNDDGEKKDALLLLCIKNVDKQMNWILFIILHYVSECFFIFIFKKKNGYPRKAYYYYRYYYYFRKKNVDLKEGMNEKHPSNIDNSFFVLLLFCLCKMRHWRILSNKQTMRHYSSMEKNFSFSRIKIIRVFQFNSNKPNKQKTNIHPKSTG